MNRRRAALAILALVAAVPAFGQSVTPPPDLHRYPLPSFDEDWRGLRQVERRDDPWDRVKFIPLSADGTTSLSFGGEARVTYERFGNQNFGLTPPDPNGYLLQRYLLHADVRAGNHLRVWTEFNSGLEGGRVGGPRPVIDQDDVDLHQTFVETAFGEASTLNVLVRAGRQEIAVGSGRLYSLREGPTVPLSFDGVRATVRRAAWRVDGWAARPVINTPRAFDDKSHESFDVWGVYAGGAVAPLRRYVNLDLYYLGLTRDDAHFDQGTANEKRHTIGARVWHGGLWLYDAEVMFQFGRFGTGNIRAWRLSGESSRLLPDVRGQPRVGVIVDAASGDKDPSDPNLQTFNAMFQSGTYSGRAQLLGPNNAVRIEPSITLAFPHRVTVAAGWGFYWRQSEHDALYGVPGQVVVPSNGVSGYYEGSRPIAQVDWQVTRHLSAHLNYIYVFNGQFEQASVHGTPTMSFVSPWVTYRF
jgi:Alginate export